MALSNITKYGEYGSADRQLSRALRKDGLGNFYLASAQFIPSSSLTVTIYNITITDDLWNRIPASATLNNVLSWDLSEEQGQRFHYAYESAPTAYKTSFGWASRNKDIPALWIKRPQGETLNMQLEVWSF